MAKKQDNKSSVYMHWAKTASSARYNLATSGVMHYPLKKLDISIDDLEISGPTFYGYEPLQKALAAKCGVEPDCVAAATGTSMANHLALAGLLEYGDEIIIEKPTYEPIVAIAKYLGASIKFFKRQFSEQFQINLDAINKLVTSKTRLIVITNFHNPSSVRTQNDALLMLGKLAGSVKARVMVDEVYLECLYPSDGERISAFHLGNQFVVTSSLTKAYGLSGLRCGWILAEPELITRFWRLNDLFGATPAHTAELLSVHALKRLPKIASWARAHLERNRSHLNQFLERNQQSVQTVPVTAGTICFPRLKSGKVDHLVQILRDQFDTSVVPGSFFDSPGHFRIGIGGPEEDLVAGLKNIENALKSIL